MIMLSKKGDTIIEVVLSMALLTSILFIAWGITNRASQISLAARDRTEMVNQVKEQAEIIKSQWAAKTTLSDTLFNYSAAGALDPNPCAGSLVAGVPTPTGGNTWHLKADSASVQQVLGIKTVGSRQFYVYVQRINGNIASSSPYSDFYVRACWINKSGSVQKQESSQVIVRLNK